MPVLGSNQAVLGVNKRGLIIPAGSLDVWRAARESHASQRVEVGIFGDSTTYGQAAGSPSYYSWVQKVRALSNAAGYTDGGRGYWRVTTDHAVSAGVAPEGDPLTSKTGFAAAALNSGMGYMWASTTAGDTLTFNLATPNCRVWFLDYPTQSASFTYSVNGGAAVRVDPSAPSSANNYQWNTFRYLTSSDGLISGANTIVINSLGGALESTPVWWSGAPVANAGAGNIPAGTYYYVITKGTQGVNETARSVTKTITLGSSSQVTATIENGTAGYPAYPSGTYNLYRGTSSSGPFGYIGSTTTASNGGIITITDNLASVGGATAPAARVGTPLNTGTPINLNVQIEPLNNTGIVYQNWGNQGATWLDVGIGPVEGTQGSYPVAARLGITKPNSTTQALTNFVKDPSANAPHPSLCFAMYGVNDATQQSAQTNPNDLTLIAARVDYFIQLCRNVGSDVIIGLPWMRQFGNLAGSTYRWGGLVKKTVADVARSHGVAMIDLDYALSLYNQDTYLESGAHLTAAGYDVVGTAIWNAIGPNSTP